ncbi:MAG: glycoside hydrolase, partial [Chloroflexota bacterium]
AYRRIYEQYEPLMRIHRDIGHQMPEALRAAAEIVLNSGLRRAFGRDDLDLDRIWGLLEEARALGVNLDEALLGYTLSGTLERRAARWQETPFDYPAVDAVYTAAALVHGLPFQVNLWRVQNALWAVQEEHLDRIRQAAEGGDPHARQWVPRLHAIAGLLGIRPRL